MIFFGTLMIAPPQINEDAWVKVKLKINSEIQACWCRVMPGRGVKFYTLDGHVIDQEESRVQVVEPCLESNTSHPIPQDEISNLCDGHLSDAWPRRSDPFSRSS